MKKKAMYFIGLIILIILLVFLIENCLTEHYATSVRYIDNDLQPILDNMQISYGKESKVEYKSNFGGFFVSIGEYEEYYMFDVIRNSESQYESELFHILQAHFSKKYLIKYKIIIGLLFICFIIYIMIPIIYTIKKLKRRFANK